MWSLVGRPLEDWQTETCVPLWTVSHAFHHSTAFRTSCLVFICTHVSLMVVSFGIPLQCWMGWSNYFAQNLTKPPWAVGIRFPVLDPFPRQPHDLTQDQLAYYPSVVCQLSSFPFFLSIFPHPEVLYPFVSFPQKYNTIFTLIVPRFLSHFAYSRRLIFLPELSLDMQICVSSRIVNTWHDIHILLFALSHLELIYLVLSIPVCLYYLMQCNVVSIESYYYTLWWKNRDEKRKTTFSTQILFVFKCFWFIVGRRIYKSRTLHTNGQLYICKHT